MKAFKFVRVLVAAIVFTLITLFFLGLGGGFGLLEKVQIVPALLGCACIPLAAWLAATLLLGRVYCSMVCPLGILQDVLARLFHRRKYKPAQNHHRMQAVALLVWAVLIGAGGVSLAGLIDPYSMFGRIASQILQPLAELCHNLAADLAGTDGAVVLFKREVFVRSVSGITVAGCALGLLVMLVAWRGRLFCTTVCPVGAMLAALSKKTVFSVAINQEKCVKCGLCSGVCKAQCLDGRNGTVDNTRCVRCFNCMGVCMKGAISFSPVWKTLPSAPEDESRRRFAMVAAAGITAAGAAVCSGRMQQAVSRSQTLPPPGSDEALLRAKCTACGLCVAKCPRKVIAPAGFSEYGALGFMMPKMDYSHGFCDPVCTTCADVCPTGAIRPLNLETKKMIKIGFAEFDRAKCLADTEKIPCGLCERRCPHKAITLKDEQVRNGGKTVKIRIPVVDSVKCTGCGACENYCPVHALKVRPLTNS